MVPTAEHAAVATAAMDQLDTIPPMIGGGAMGQHVRDTDWSQTPLGAYATWPQSLRSSLSLVLNTKGIAALYWGPEQWLLYNDAYGAALGDRHPQAFGRPMPEVLTDIAPVLGPQVAEVLRTGQGFAIENLPMVMHRHDRDEETIWTYSFSPVQGETGGFAGVLLLATEMTQQKAAERAEKRSRVRLDTAFRAAGLGSYDWHPATGVVEVNARAREIFALPPSGLVRDAEIFARIAPEELDRVQAASMAAAGLDVSFDDSNLQSVLDLHYDIIHPDGSRRSVTSSGNIIQDPDGSRRMVGTFNDVTEIKRAEATIRAERDQALERETSTQTDAERVKLALAAGAIIGTWHWDLPTDRFTVDDAFAHAFSLDPALGRDGIPLAQIVATVHPDDQAGLADAINDAIARCGRYAHQYRVRRADGRYYWIEANGRVDAGSDGQPQSFPGVLLDVGSRRAERLLADLAERLRTLETPQAMAYAAAETVGVALGVSRAAYGDIDAEGLHITLEQDWLADGQRSLAGKHQFAAYGSYIEALRRGEDVIINNVATDARTAAAAEDFRQIDVGALVNLPLLERGKLKVVFCLNHSRPHTWSDEELTFAHRVMERTEVEIARWQAERALRLSEARHRHSLQQMPGFVGVLVGPEHIYEYVNDAYIRIAGPREYIGRSVRDVFPDIEGQGFLELLDQVYATGEPFSARAMPIQLFGEEESRFIDLLFQPLRADNGEVTGIFVGGYDVTEQNRTQLALRDLNANLERQVAERALARGRTWQLTPEIMGVINADGYFEQSNPAWATVLGWTEEEVARTIFFDFIHPDDLAQTKAAWTAATELGIPALNFENRYRHKDGTWRWLSWVAVPGDGKVYCSARDITANKEQASALLQTEEALRQAQKMEAVGQLTGGVAHDFNNLLTIIRSSVDFLRRPELPDARKQRYLNAVSDTVDRAAKLTSQLLAFARRQALKPEVFDVGAQLRGIGDMLDTVTGARVTVTIKAPIEPCFIKADVSQFETALVNMAVNARDAMDGEGNLTLHLAPASPMPQIRGHGGSRAEFMALSVTDTGTGIAPDQISRIFEPFFTTKEVGKGTGLGLSQVFGFAKQSGGDVDVTSVLGTGTTFTLYLPQETTGPVSAESTEVAEAPLNPAGAGQRVLVVEDNIEVGQFCTQILEDLGYAPEWVANGEDALARLGTDGNGFSVVFSDVVMPGMGGIALAKILRERLPNLPVVLASGYSHVLARETDHGFELLHKPYSAEQVACVLQRKTGQRAMSSKQAAS